MGELVPRPLHTVEESLSLLRDAGWRKGGIPLQWDLEPGGLLHGETPSPRWYRRWYPGGWDQALTDAFGIDPKEFYSEAKSIGGSMANRGANFGFKNPDTRAKALATRRANGTQNNFRRSSR